MNKHPQTIGKFIRMAAIARSGAEIKVTSKEDMLFFQDHDYETEFQKKRDILELLAREAVTMPNNNLAGIFREVKVCIDDMLKGVSNRIKVRVLNTFLTELSASLVRVAASTASWPKSAIPIKISKN